MDHNSIQKTFKMYFRSTGEILIDEQDRISCNGNIFSKDRPFFKFPVKFGQIKGDFIMNAPKDLLSVEYYYVIGFLSI